MTERLTINQYRDVCLKIYIDYKMFLSLLSRFYNVSTANIYLIRSPYFNVLCKTAIEYHYFQTIRAVRQDLRVFWWGLNHYINMYTS